MPSTITATAAALNTFDENLKLPKGVASTARAKRDGLVAVLTDAGLVKEAFGQGSFARGTMRKPLKDVDTVVVLPERLRDELYSPSGAAKVFGLFQNALQSSGKFPGAQYDPPSPQTTRSQWCFRGATSAST